MYRAAKHLLPPAILAVLGPLATWHVVAAQSPIEDAWKMLPSYEYGQDMEALLAIDRVVIESMASPQTRSACAARLAAFLADTDTTPPARRYICLQLRQIGTSAQVPLLTRLLEDPETSQEARYALETIPGPEAASALREALKSLDGKRLVGVIHSVAARKDTATVSTLARLADSPDEQVAHAALWALGNVANDQAAAFLAGRAEKAGIPMPQDLAVPLLRCAEAYAGAGQRDAAEAIYNKLSQAGQPVGVRRAALGGLLQLGGDQKIAMILDWFSGPDMDRRRVASGQLHTVSDEQLDRLLEQLPELPRVSKLTVMELAVSRRGKPMLPMVMSLVHGDQLDGKLTGIRYLGMIGDASAIPLLLGLLATEGELREAAQDALLDLPRNEVSAALLDALSSRPLIRVPVISVLVKLKCYEAIDPLIEIASASDPAIYAPALEGLRGIADPDKTDIPRLVGLLLKTEPGRHRDEVEKTILVVCDKLTEGSDRSELVLGALARADRSETLQSKYLPLLGRLGGPKSLEMIQSGLGSTDAAIQEAAVRGLCNWPSAEVADKLLGLATSSDSRAYRVWALRAYIRVVTLPNQRPEAETLAMLRHAMKLADGVDEKRLALGRASTVRNMETVTWIASYLDDPELGQSACATLVELAHHRFLRNPNMDRFGPILEKVDRVSKDPAVAERARRYRLGL